MIRSFSVEIIKPVNCTWDQAGDALWLAKKATVAAANLVRTNLLRMDTAFDEVKFINNQVSLPKRNGKVSLPKLEKTDQRLYENIRKRFPFLNARLINYLVRDVRMRYMSDRFDALIGKDRIATYTRYSFQNDQCNIEETEYGTIFHFALLSKESKLDCPRRLQFLINVQKLKWEYRDIIKEIISGKRKLGATRIKYVDRKKKWMVSIPFEMESAETKLVEGRVLEVFPPGNGKILRISYQPKKGRISKPEDVRSQDLEFSQACRYRKSYERHSRAISNTYRQQSRTGTKGHGRKRALKNKSKFQDKYKRATTTFNQQLASCIVRKYALRWKCSAIEYMSPADVDLKGYNLLHSWPWYQLETCIKNKAEEFGIRFQKIEGDKLKKAIEAFAKLGN